MLFVATVSAGSVLPTPISDDPYTDAGSSHQHKTQVEPDSFAFGQTIVALTQSGRWFSGGGSSNLVFSSSQNGGRTWTTGGLPGTTINSGGPWPRISDPSVAFDPQDNVWLALGLGIDAGGSGHILLVNRSTDGGVTWSNPVTAGTAPGTFWDKTWITCDTWAESPHYGNCYVEFDDASAGDRMSMVTSTDGGVTWGSVLSPPGCSSGLGGQPVVQPNGNVIVPYSNDGGAESSFRSTNGGTSWGDCVLVSNVTEHGVAANIRTFSLPSAEVAGDGKVYLAWQDCRFRTNCQVERHRVQLIAGWPDVVDRDANSDRRPRQPYRPLPARDRSRQEHGGQLDAPRRRLLLLPQRRYLQHKHVSDDRRLHVVPRWRRELDAGPVDRRPDARAVDRENGPGLHGRRLHLDVVHGRRQGAPVFSLAKAPDSGVNGSCYPNNTGCHQRLTSVSVDITQPPPVAPVRTRREPIARGLHRHPEETPLAPRTAN